MGKGLKLLQTEITPLTREFVHVEYRKQAFLSSPFHTKPSFHAHPELELVFIEEGFGKRIIGNKVEYFEAGDMVLVGAHVPHVWLSDPVFYEVQSHRESKAIITYLHPVVFEQIFNLLKELQEIKELFQHAHKGIRIFGDTSLTVAEQMKAMSGMEGFEKIETLLRIMYLISISKETAYIDNEGLPPQEHAQRDRLVDVLNYIQAHLMEPITLKQVADIACMADPSFSRFFKLRMKTTFTQYLEDIRINHALDLLIQTDKPISAIAESSGYKCSSHFCKVFKEHFGKSPYQYKRDIVSLYSK